MDGKTGFVVDSMEAMIEAVGHIDSINPRECREHVQNHFSITSMAGKYSALYHQIIGSHKTTDSHSRFSTGHSPKPVSHGIRAA